MNAEVKAKWLEALRSGEYEQGRGRLARITAGYRAFCCLGVLCDLAVKANVKVLVRSEAMQFSDTGDDNYLTYDGTPHYLPESVRKWAGIQSESPRVDGRSLADLNDEVGLDFPDIADLIEQYL